jgi:hypothetical protein
LLSELRSTRPSALRRPRRLPWTPDYNCHSMQTHGAAGVLERRSEARVHKVRTCGHWGKVYVRILGRKPTSFRTSVNFNVARATLGAYKITSSGHCKRAGPFGFYLAECREHPKLEVSVEFFSEDLSFQNRLINSNLACRLRRYSAGGAEMSTRRSACVQESSKRHER